MIDIFKWSSLTGAAQTKTLRRPTLGEDDAVAKTVADIFSAVHERGDSALRELTQKFDGIDVPHIPVSAAEMARSKQNLDPALEAAMLQAIDNIRRFHELQKPCGYTVEISAGLSCSLEWRAIEKVGLYVPGGSAPLFSSVLMQAIPAKLAGCKQIVLCAPPERSTGRIAPIILTAAHLCGIDNIYCVGGAQAIAALSYGTTTIPKVDKIFGPGNSYVVRAKEYAAQLSNGPAIDMPAGPSEVMVIADAHASPSWVAADLLAQAEHDALSQVMLIVPSAEFAKNVIAQLDLQKKTLPRVSIVDAALVHARFIVANDLEMAVDIANLYAPEHLILHCETAAQMVAGISNAGSVFVGAMTPETAGDYASGTNHVLPTSGRSRAYGGLSLFSFMKSMSVQTLSQKGIASLAPVLATLARAEGLEAHARAALIRLETTQ